MNTAQIIPFKFETREVRTLLIDDQPWFVASDVASALCYRDAFNMCRNLDEDEKGTQIVSTPGCDQEMTVINESGLYSAILRSRKAEAKRFKKWVTAEVLPAIRKHGRYEDSSNKMGTLIGETIGTNGFNMLGALIKGKVVSLPVQAQRKAAAKIWAQTHAAFGVRSAADIPADKLDAARNFIAAYALEGEWLGREDQQPAKLDIECTIEEWKAKNPNHFNWDNPDSADLKLGYGDLLLNEYSPCLELLDKLHNAGYCIDGAYYEFRSYQNLMRRMDLMMRTMAGKIRSAFIDFEGDRQRPHVYPGVKSAKLSAV